MLLRAVREASGRLGLALDRYTDDMHRARLYRRLREVRAVEAQRAAIPAHHILGDPALQAVAGARPGSAAVLRAVPGVPLQICERYGAPLLALLVKS